MLELPETLAMSSQLKEAVVGKEIECVLPPNKKHKFCWYNGEPQEYNDKIAGSKVEDATAFGIYVELAFDNGYKLCINDGVNVRFVKKEEVKKSYQLMLVFTDDTALVFTVAMYGGIYLHQGDYNNEYYLKSRFAVSPFDKEFEAYYKKLLMESKPTLSMKAFLATEQRIPGIGNGVVQDILFRAGLHPKRKLMTLEEEEENRLFTCIVEVLQEMRDKGGRDTEKDLYGYPCGYQTLMSKNSLTYGCPECGGTITKEAYLGGSVYYCPHCQPLV